ncbi:hypothetical protein CIRG_00180 [Coccidioides immitis RMSCC 2394]|uniref:Uncharacterized protein n=1 Tax=Coccidioides immitis RMSCC 2394 TaxID=404692 RepID=A0A0J6Y0G7_COCIT|nr:hypothetical protein CIRG_00180 [Coccidioides immitis RMSCC 2394]
MDSQRDKVKVLDWAGRAVSALNMQEMIGERDDVAGEQTSVENAEPTHRRHQVRTAEASHILGLHKERVMISEKQRNQGLNGRSDCRWIVEGTKSEEKEEKKIRTKEGSQDEGEKEEEERMSVDQIECGDFLSLLAGFSFAPGVESPLGLPLEAPKLSHVTLASLPGWDPEPARLLFQNLGEEERCLIPPLFFQCRHPVSLFKKINEQREHKDPARLINNDEEIRRWIEIADCAKTWLAAVSRWSRVGFGVLVCRQNCWNVRLMEHNIRRQGREAVELKLSQQQTGLRPVIREKRSLSTLVVDRLVLWQREHGYQSLFVNWSQNFKTIKLSTQSAYPQT